MVFLASQLFFTDSNGDIRNVIGQKETVLRFIGDVDDTKDSLIHDFSPALRIADLKDEMCIRDRMASSDGFDLNDDDIEV